MVLLFLYTAPLAPLPPPLFLDTLQIGKRQDKDQLKRDTNVQIFFFQILIRQNLKPGIQH